MTRLLTALEASVRRAPATLAVLTVLVTAVLGVVSSRAVQEQGFANFSPDNEITQALTTISDRFGTGVEPVQLVVVSDDGPLLEPPGVAAAVTIRERILTDERVSGVLAQVPHGQPVVTYADPVLEAANAAGRDPSALQPGEPAALWQGTLDAMPPGQQRAQAAQLLGGGAGPSADVGAVLVLLDGDRPQDDRREAIGALDELSAGVDGVEVTVLDMRLMAEEVSSSIEGDLARLLAVAFLLIVAILVAIYRRPVDVVASLLGLVFTIVWMQGISTLLGPAFLGWTGGMSEMTMAIPILLVGLGVDYGIHLTMRYREERSHGNLPGGAVTGAIGAVGAALALATLTTVVGFLTNLANPLPPLRDFGVFAAVGVGSAFLIMTTFVPAVRLAADRALDRRGRLRVEAPHGDRAPTLLGRLAAALAPAATHHPAVVLAAAGVLTLLGAMSATNLSTQFTQTEFFPEGSEALATIELVEEHFGGGLTERAQVLVTGDLDRPGTLAALDALEDAAARVPGVRAADGRAEIDSVLSRVGTLVERAAGAAAAGGATTPGSPAPGDDAAPGQELAGQPSPDPAAVGRLLEAADAAGVGSAEGIDPQAAIGPLAQALLALDPSAAAIVSPPDAMLVTISTDSSGEVDELRDGLTAAAGRLDGLGLDVVVASEPILIERVLDELRGSQVTGLVWTLAAAMLILSVAFWFRSREPLLGVLAIASVGLVVAWVLGVMALVDIPFNVMTAMVSALAIGIGVPFGIHVVNRHLEDRDRFDDPGDAVRSTLRNTGGALVGSAVTTMAGFGSLALSAVPPFRQFGIVVAMTIGFALVASVVVLPAMLSVYERVRRGRRAAADGTGSRDVAGVRSAPVG